MLTLKDNRFVLLFLLAGLLLGGCGGGGDYQVVAQQLEELKRELNQLKAGSAHNAVVMEDLQNKLLLMEDRVESNHLLLARRGTQSGPMLPVVKLTPNQPHQGAAHQAPAEAAPPVPEVRLSQLNESGLIVNMNGQPVEANPPQRAAAPAEPKRRSFDSRPVELYKHAFELLKQKRHHEALAEFDEFLAQYPNHDYSDNALYWMGEAYYDLQNYPQARVCFEKVVTLYPNGNKVPDAMLKIGLCHANSGDSSNARAVMDKLVAHFPATRAANIAQQKLKALQ